MSHKRLFLVSWAVKETIEEMYCQICKILLL